MSFSYEQRVTFVATAHVAVRVLNGAHAGASRHLASVVRSRDTSTLIKLPSGDDESQLPHTRSTLTVLSSVADAAAIEALLRSVAAELRFTLEIVREQIDLAPVQAALACTAVLALRAACAKRGLYHVGGVYISGLDDIHARRYKLDALKMVVRTRDVEANLGRSFDLTYCVSSPLLVRAAPLLPFVADGVFASAVRLNDQHSAEEETTPIFVLPRLKPCTLRALAATPAELETDGDKRSRERGFGLDLPNSDKEHVAMWTATTDLPWLSALLSEGSGDRREGGSSPHPALFAALVDKAGEQHIVPTVFAWRSFTQLHRAPPLERAQRVTANAEAVLESFALRLDGTRAVAVTRVASSASSSSSSSSRSFFHPASASPPTTALAAAAAASSSSSRTLISAAPLKPRAAVKKTRRLPSFGSRSTSSTSVAVRSLASSSARRPMFKAVAKPRKQPQPSSKAPRRPTVRPAPLASAPSATAAATTGSSIANALAAELLASGAFDDDPAPKKKKARKSASKKKLTAEELAAAAEAVALVLRNGGELSACKLWQLKAYLKKHTQKVSGKKADLVSRVHLLHFKAGEQLC